MSSNYQLLMIMMVEMKGKTHNYMFNWNLAPAALFYSAFLKYKVANPKYIFVLIHKFAVWPICVRAQFPEEPQTKTIGSCDCSCRQVAGNMTGKMRNTLSTPKQQNTNTIGSRDCSCLDQKVKIEIQNAKK